MPNKSNVQATYKMSDGLLTTSGTISRKPGPVGNVSLIELIIQGMEPGQFPITVNIKGLKDTSGQPLEATPKPGLVTIKPFTTVEIGSASIVVGTASRIPITIKDYDDPAGLGSTWLEITYPRRALEVSSIDGGDVTFDSPPKQQVAGVDIPVGVITINAAPTRKLRSQAEIILAYLTVMPLAEGEFRFSIRGGNLSNSQNQPINAKGMEGVISAKSPFKISSFAISPRQPSLKEKATLTATITNTGTERATYPARFWIGATLEESGSVVMEANETRNISFSASRDVPGIYKAMLGEAELQFTVVNPADLKLSNLTVRPGAPEAGETVTVSARVENSGKVEAIYTARLRINQVLRDTKELSLKPGEKRDVVFPIPNLPPGDYAVDLDGLTVSFSVPGVVKSPPYMLWLAIIAALEAIVIVFLLFRMRSAQKK
jgi:hypothetical protein